MDKGQAELTLQSLLYVARLASDEDYATALNLGLRREQVERIRWMPVEALHELALSVRVRITRVVFDPEALDTGLQILLRRNEERQLARDLILAGASFGVMSELFGMSNASYSNHRKVLGLSDYGIGRTVKPPEAVQTAIWRAWQEHPQLDEKQRLLAVHHQTHAEIRAIWALLREWQATGLTPILDEEKSLPIRKSRGSAQTRRAAGTSMPGRDDG